MHKEDPMEGAARWFIDLITAPDVSELWTRFEQWLQQTSDNRTAYEEIERAWSAMDGMRRTHLANKRRCDRAIALH